MTVQPTRDQLDRAEHRIARLEAQTSIRGRAVVIYRDRARKAEAERDRWREYRDGQAAELARSIAAVTLCSCSAQRSRADRAEARIKAVQHLIDQADEAGDSTITCTRLQFAIDGEAA